MVRNRLLVDWGTTNARAWLVDGAGVVIERRSAPCGIRNVDGRRFAEAFDGLVGPLRDGDDVPVLMSGMIGSRQGWREAPYAECPASLAALCAALVPVDERPGVWIVPGVCLAQDAGRRDVMRGEEVQCFGALADMRLADAVLCLPGTHSKWVRASGGRIVDFATAMTGEVFDVLRRHSILGALMEGDRADATAFREGLRVSGETGGLLAHLFGVRSRGLFADIAGSGLPDYLSGMLIGHEVRSLAARWASDAPLLLVSSGPLAERYADAMNTLGISFRPVAAEAATLSGLLAIGLSA